MDRLVPAVILLVSAACVGCGASGASSSDSSVATNTTGATTGGTTAITGGTTAITGGTTASGTAATGSATGSTTAATTAGTTATTGATTTSTAPTTFDGTRAFTVLQDQCNIGPRPMGTAAHDQCLQYILNKLTPLVDAAPIQQSFTYKSPTTGQSFTVTNIIGRINPTAATQVMLAAHWDTRPFADQDQDPNNWTKPILGANDGASETAVLLELARVFHANRPTVGVEFAFFDGEDYAPVPDHNDQHEAEMYLGSKYLASHLTVGGISLKPAYGVLLDMIGDKELGIYQEQNSVQRAPAVVTKVWSAAAALGYGGNFIPQPKYDVDDDHLPLLNAGVPFIDCIDFDYESFQDPTRQYWHTLMDTPDHCSSQSLQIVGNVISKVVYAET